MKKLKEIRTNGLSLPLISFCLLVIFVSCTKFVTLNNAQESTGGKNLTMRSVDTTLQDYMPFPIGASISTNRLGTAIYKATVIKEYNSLTGEGVMKMNALKPTSSTYNWTNADSLVRFAEANGKRVHGHTLVWGSVPSWVTNYVGDSTAWENLLKDYIQTVVTHFKGHVGSWDVVNEAIADNGTFRNNIWHQRLGPGYVARSFQYAHEADSTALLFLNDYGQEYSTARRNAINNLAKSMRDNGIPIHGVGLQMHTNISVSQAGYKRAIDSAAATGLLVHISELDIAVNVTASTSYTFNLTDEQTQADYYEYIVNTYKTDVPVAQQFGITTWNVADFDTWRRPTYGIPEYPLPFNDSYGRKLAYYAIIAAAN